MTGDMALSWQDAEPWQDSSLDAARGIVFAVLLSSVVWAGLAISVMAAW